MRARIFFLLTLAAAAQAQRYCNPLPLPSYPVQTDVGGRGFDVRSMADPTVAEFRGSFYLAGNGSGLYRSAQPLGPWEFLGDFTDDQGKRFSPFDPT